MDSPSACAERNPKKQTFEQENKDNLRYYVHGPSTLPDGFEALAGEWNSLLHRSRSNVIFLTHEWQSTWWRQLGTGELWIIEFRQADSGQLVRHRAVIQRRVHRG